LSEEFNPQNTRCIPPVKFFFRLELEQTKQFSNTLSEAIGIQTIRKQCPHFNSWLSKL
jgi:hypothetical protein